MSGIKELLEVYGIIRQVAYNGWQEDREAYFTLPPRRGARHSEISVKNPRAYEILGQMERDAGRLARRYLERLDEMGQE